MIRRLCSINPFKLFFISETTLTEFVIGIISVVVGAWFAFTLLPHNLYTHASLIHTCGGLLIFSGALKVVGTCTLRIAWRTYSCMLATLVWIFVGYAFIDMKYYPAVATLGVTIPLACVMSLVNALLYIKLVIVEKSRKRKTICQTSG